MLTLLTALCQYLLLLYWFDIISSRGESPRDASAFVRYIPIFLVGIRMAEMSSDLRFKRSSPLSRKKNSTPGIEFFRRRDFLKPSGARVIGQSWVDQLSIAHVRAILEVRFLGVFGNYAHPSFSWD